MANLELRESIHPLEVVQAQEAKIAETIGITGSVIMAENVDVLIEAKKYTYVSPRDEAFQAPILGPLYETDLQEYTYEDQVWLVRTFPSAPRVNETMEELGLRPGEDVVRFARYPGGMLRSDAYSYALTQKEFPQATFEYFFEHDRNADHAPGALLLPPRALDNIQAMARVALSKRQMDKVSELFDRATNHTGDLAQQWVKKGHLGMFPFFDSEDAKKLRHLTRRGPHVPILQSMLVAGVLKDRFEHMQELVQAHIARTAVTSEIPEVQTEAGH